MLDDFQTQRQKDNCEGCFFCDEAAIGKGPCCTYAGTLECNEDGTCKTKKPKEGIERSNVEYQAQYAYACGYHD